MHLIKKTLKKGMVAAIQIQDCISAKRRIAHQGRIVFLSTDFQLLATLGYFCMYLWLLLAFFWLFRLSLVLSGYVWLYGLFRILYD